MAKSEHKKRYDKVLSDVIRAIKKNDVASFDSLLARVEEFPTLKVKYGPQLKRQAKETAEDILCEATEAKVDENVSHETKIPNGDPFDTLYRRQRK